MAIVPSGKLRFMQAQQLQQSNVPVGPDANQTEFKKDLPGTTPPQTNNPGVSPADKLKQQLDSQTGASPKGAPPDSMQIQNALSGKNEDIKNKTEAKSQKWREIVFDSMSHLGVDQEVINIIKNNPELYHTEWNNQTKTLTGYFYLPGRFDPNEIAKIYDPLAQRMGYIIVKITQENVKGNHGPKAYQKVVFETKPIENPGVDPNMDFAEFMGGDQKGRNAAPQAKSAFTQNDMIKQGKSELFEHLIKIGLEKR